MGDRERRRALTVPAIARITRSRDFRPSLGGSAAKDPRSQTIVPALPDDSMGYVLDRVQEAGGTAVVAMVADGTCQIAVLWPASEARLAVAEEDDAVTGLHEDIRVDMFFDYLTYLGTAAVVRRVTARLVTSEPLQPV